MIAFVFQPRRVGKKDRLYSARVRLDGWPETKTFRLRVSDRRVAQEKLRELVQDFEREAVGILAPKTVREAAQRPLNEHLAAFLADVAGSGRSPNTVNAYRKVLGKLFVRCGWRLLRDVSQQSFTKWRALGEVGPKFARTALRIIRSGRSRR
jgi:hypothetical protein